MRTKFKARYHVRRNSKASHVNGKIVKMHSSDTDYEGDRRRGQAQLAVEGVRNGGQRPRSRLARRLSCGA